MNARGKMALALVAAVTLAWLAAGCNKTKPRAESKPKVLVQAFYPLSPEHKYIADYIKSLNAKYPGQVKAEVYDMQNSEDRKEWSKTGLGCAGVFVNGRTRHVIARAGGKKETVDFLKRMDNFWTKDDFETVLKAELAHPSPLPPGGYSTSDPGTAAASSKAPAASGAGAKADKPAAKKGA